MMVEKKVFKTLAVFPLVFMILSFSIKFIFASDGVLRLGSFPGNFVVCDFLFI